jgi:cytochrome d ubiquinol oxidase subunit II
VTATRPGWCWTTAAANLGLADLAVPATGLKSRGHLAPFAGATLVFLSGYLGLAADFFPYLPPYAMTFGQAASTDNALALILSGVIVLLPAMLGLAVLVYWLFRGKVSADAGYH